jgi:hypothetical protein
MSNCTFRLAVPEDAEAFTKWSLENPQIDPKDRLSATKAKNPTCLYFVVERDGKIVTFAPVYAQMVLAHLSFNPEASGRDKLKALEVLTDGVSALAVQLGIREIVTLSKEEYPVARWAVKHDFEVDPRQLFRLDLNKVLEVAEVA